MTDFPTIDPALVGAASGGPIYAEAAAISDECRRARRGGFLVIGRPFRPVERGLDVLVVGRGYVGAGVSGIVATMNPYRPDARATAAAICNATNAYAELVAVLRLLVAAGNNASHPMAGPSDRAELSVAVAAAADAMSRWT